MKKILIGLAAAMALYAVLVNSAVADDYSVGIEGRIWAAEIGGNIKASDNGVLGTAVNITSDLDLTDLEEIPEFAGFFKLTRDDRINFHYWFVGFNGEKVLSQEVKFGGSTYLVGTRVESNLEARVGTVSYERILFSEKGTGTGFELGAQLGAKYMSFSGKLTAPSASLSEDESLIGFVPVAGLRAKLDLSEWISIEGQVNGVSVNNIRGVDATILEATAELQANVYEGVYASVGYHIFDVNIDADLGTNESFKVDTTIDGFFFSIGYRF